VNVDGLAQGVVAGAKAPGQARAGWKVLRALGGALRFDGFAFDDLAGLRAGMAERSAPAAAADFVPRQPIDPSADGTLARFASWPIYRGDAVLRRAKALNAHPLNRAPAARVNAAEAQRLNLDDGCQVQVADGVLPLVVDDTVADGTVWIEAANDLTATLPPYGAALTLRRV
jgi:NADH-quinone oxidoreductase subunit G